MDYPGFLESFDLRHRDPQGRTLLLSACRSAAGANVLAGTGVKDISLNVEDEDHYANALPKWNRDSGPTDSDFKVPGGETLVEILLRLGADPLATDNQRKTALHHLLVEVRNNQNSNFYRLPVVRRTLHILTSRCPSLVNQPDRYGTFPLHAALRRMRLHIRNNLYIDMAELTGCIREMLRAGADPRAKDGKGNTILHYLADDDLTGIWFCTERRQIFYELLENGCSEDINVPNEAGKTVAELIFDDNGRLEDDKDTSYGFMRRPKDGQNLRTWQDVDGEVFKKLEEAGIEWTVKTSQGGTLLHLVAKAGLEVERLVWRSRFLVQRGVSPKTVDENGMTAKEVAVESELNKKDLYRVLDELEDGKY